MNTNQNAEIVAKQVQNIVKALTTEEPYNGNQIVVKRHKHKVFGKFHTDVWDGETQA